MLWCFPAWCHEASKSGARALIGPGGTLPPPPNREDVDGRVDAGFSGLGTCGIFVGGDIFDGAAGLGVAGALRDSGSARRRGSLRAQPPE
jgi:hypothetical protein